MTSMGIDAETMGLLRASVRALLSDLPPDLTGALDELGWDEVVEEDAKASYMTLFGLQGELCATTALLDGVAARALGLHPHTRVIWPWPDGREDTLGIALSDIPADAAVVVPAGDGVVPVQRAALRLEEIRGIDPGAGWLRVSGRAADGPVSGNWADAVSAARLAIAAELLGAGRRTLDIASEHVSSRVQFGRPIGSFQAVRHVLAGAHASLAGAEALLTVAWDQGGESAAAVAKVAASAACRVAGAAATQVCGGMGLSEEHPLPASVRRAMLLDGLLGDTNDLYRDLGRQLRSGPIPEPAGDF